MSLHTPTLPPRPILTARIAENGDLRITASNEARRWMREERERGLTDDCILWDGFEGYWNNGSFSPFDAGYANPFVGLTDAPCIAEDMTTHDNGDREIYGRLWWFPNYMVRSFVDDLLTKGSTVFKLA